MKAKLLERPYTMTSSRKNGISHHASGDALITVVDLPGTKTEPAWPCELSI